MQLTLELSPDLGSSLVAEAERRGTTPELLILEGVRRVLPPAAPEGRTLLDFLDGYVGTVAGTGEAFSQDCGQRFADDLAAGRKARP